MVGVMSDSEPEKGNHMQVVWHDYINRPGGYSAKCGWVGRKFAILLLYNLVFTYKKELDDLYGTLSTLRLYLASALQI